MKILKNGVVVINPDGHVIFTDFTVDLEDADLDYGRMARHVLDDAYQRALVALGEVILLDVSKADAVH